MAPRAADVAIVGAGPFGLSVAAHLRARGVGARVFGEPMAGWRDHMPAGMFVRTPWETTHIADPDGALTLDRWAALGGAARTFPLPLADFVRYGLWFQERAVPDVDRRLVARVVPDDTGWRVVLDDGEEVRVARVVVATGLAFLAYRPPEFGRLNGALVSHTSQHSRMDGLRGRRVVVVGGGLSAFEYAVHLREVGADVEVVMRAAGVRWIDELRGIRPAGRSRALYRRVRPHLGPLHPPTAIGPPPVSWLVAAPGAFRRTPWRVRRRVNRLVERGIIEHGSSWLAPGLDGVTITAARRVTRVERRGGGLVLALDDGSRRTVEHVLLATGYRADVDRYPFLDAATRARIARLGSYPRLGAGFESSIPGLHFVGPIAQGSFGPLMYAVAGTPYAARAVTARVLAGRNGGPA
jgi:thioredoxin reductase